MNLLLRTMLGVNIVTLLIIASTGCRKQQVACVNETINLGRIELDESSRAFLGYRKGDTLVYKNIQNDEIYFIHDKAPSRGFVETGWVLPCEFGVNTYEFETEVYGNSIVSEDLNLQLNLNLYPNMSREVELFVDRIYGVFKLSNSSSTPGDSLIEMRIITSFKGNEQIEEEFRLQENYNFLENYEVLNMQFDSVYFFSQQTKVGLSELAFSRKVGLVSFRDTLNNQWVFDRKF